MGYWENRQARAQDAISRKNLRQIEKQLGKYYASAMKKAIAEFESVYDKILSQKEQGKEVTPALLYRLDSYWALQAQLRRELEKLGEKQIALLSKHFEINYFEVYYALEIKGLDAFSTIDKAGVQQMINSVWVADGKTFSQRVWGNVEKLVETLNEELVHCVATGKKTTELKQKLQERFGVSYSRADTLARTELAHIQTEAAKHRYKDYGLKEYEILGNDDDSCGGSKIDCHKLHGKKFKYSEMVVGKNAPPFHPNCKCCIVPVIE
jgi:SPP1 gp7 family putative phage head morphogenesis protein